MDLLETAKTASIQLAPAIHNKRVGGRVTKWKGKTASCAPQTLASFISVSGLAALFTLTPLALPAASALASSCGDGAVVASGTACSVTSLANSYNPVLNDNLVGAAIATQGETINVVGNAADFVPGQSGFIRTRPVFYDELVGKSFFYSGTQDVGVSIIDAVTGSSKVVPVYNNSYFSEISLLSNYSTVEVKNDVGDNQYIQARIGTAIGPGSQINVNIDGGVSRDNNLFKLGAKQTDLTEASNGGEVVWRSRNATSTFTAESSAGNQNERFVIQHTIYAGTLNFNGIEYPINSVEDVKAYNNVLIDALKNGAITHDRYVEEFKKTFTVTQLDVSHPYTISEGDDVTRSIGRLTTMHATGAGSRATIASTGQIDTVDMHVLVDNNATFHNEVGGRLSAWYKKALQIESGATGVNDGVIAGGYLIADNIDPSLDQVIAENRSGYTITVLGSGSSFTNNGIINLAALRADPNAFWEHQYAILTDNNASAINNGIINVGVNSGFAGNSYGARIFTGSFTNETTGEIYIGRRAQYQDANGNPTAADTIGVANSMPQFGVNVVNQGVIENKGQITIGPLTQNAVGIATFARNADTRVVNSGQIRILGRADGSPLQNIGMLAQDNFNSQVSNAGLIDLVGVNGTGVKVISTGETTASARTASTSVINVSGGADPVSGTRNYGVWVEGASTQLASADIDGQINLIGDGGIGVHARGLARVAVNASAVPSFQSGSKQIGFFIYGPDAKIDVASSSMNVSTRGSTLFRIADGADITAAGLTITTSGEEAVGILGTGEGTSVDANGGTFNVTGNGSTAVIVAGGAKATMNGANITLSGANSVAGVADGQKRDLSGEAIGSPNSATSLNAVSNLQSGAEAVTGFIARNQGTVNVSGKISLSNERSVGVVTQDSASAVISNAEIDTAGWATRSLGGTNSFNVANSRLDGRKGVFNVTGGSTADFTATNSILNGNIISDSDSNGRVFLRNNTKLTGMIDPVSLDIDNSSSWDVTASSELSSLVNAGNIRFLYDGGRKTITTNNYVGNNGVIVLNTYVNTDGDPSDRLVIDGGSATGTTTLDIVNDGGPGNYTLNGIKVVDAINGGTTAAEAFRLQGPVVAGAFAYTLERGPYQAGTDAYGDSEIGHDWYLRSEIEPKPEPQPQPQPQPGPGPQPSPGPGPQPAPGPVPLPDPERYQEGVPVYEAYPQVLLELAGLPTLQQRVGNRYWKMVREPETVFCKDAAQQFRCTLSPEQSSYFSDGKQRIDSSGLWGRIDGSRTKIDSRFSTSQSDYDINLWKIQAGLDFSLHEAADGSMLIGGVTLQYGDASANIKSLFGSGKISTQAYGVGATLTWYGANGFYVDAQGQYNWFDSNLSANSLGNLIEGNNGKGYALSIETGKKYHLENDLALTPQAQLIYSAVDFSSFLQNYRGRDVASVSLNSAESLRGRLGLALEKQNAWKADNGTTSRLNVYGITNLYYEFLDGTEVGVSGINLKNERDRLWGGVGIGASYNWNDDKYSLYGEGSIDTSLNNFGSSNKLKGTVGLRIKW